MTEDISDWTNRKDDQRLTEIHTLVKENSIRLDSMEKRIEPVLDVYDDIAAVARVGRLMKSIILWVVALAGSIAGGLAIFHKSGGS